MNKLRLLQLRKENNMTQDELCAILKERFNYDIQKSMISRYENGIHEPNFYFVDLASAVFGVTTDYMMGRSEQRYGSENTAKRIPVQSKDGIKKYEFVEDDCDYCVEATDDSMSGSRIYTRDTLFIKKQSNVNHGEIALIQIENEQIIRRVFKINGTIILHPENPSYQDAIYSKKESKQIKILGKVRYIKAEVK